MTHIIVDPGYDEGGDICNPPNICFEGGLGNGGMDKCNYPYKVVDVPFQKIVCYPEVPPTPGSPYIKGTPAQISRNYNEGWRNSCSSTVDTVNPGQYFECSISPDIQGIFLGLDIIDSELQLIRNYEHGLMISKDGVQVWENGVPVKVLVNDYGINDLIQIKRHVNGMVSYSVVSGLSEYSYQSQDLVPATYTTPVYAVMYRGYDIILSASIKDFVQPVDISGELRQYANIGFGVGNSAIFDQYIDVDFKLSFNIYLEQSVDQLIRMNYSSYGVGQASFGALVAFGCEGDHPTIGKASFGAMVCSAEIGGYVPPPLEGGMAMFGPMVCSALIVDVDIGEGNASFGALTALGMEQDAMYGRASFGALTAKAWEEPEGYLGLYMDMTLDSSHAVLVDKIISLFESLQVEDSFSLFREFIIDLTEAMTIEDSFSFLRNSLINLYSSLTVKDELAFDLNNLPDFAGGPAWVMNLDTGGTTIYKDYDFNSFFTKDGITYGVASNGIWKLQDTDQPAPEAYIDYGQSKYGTSRFKRIPYWYAAAATSGKLILRVEVNDRKWYYEMDGAGSSFVTNHKIKVGKGLKSVLWNPVLIAPEGVKLEELESLHFETIVLKRNI